MGEVSTPQTPTETADKPAEVILKGVCLLLTLVVIMIGLV
nr:MAG TPA: hypothetical protein [Caudoviricetes sp.]